MVTERALAVLFLTELATVTVSPTVALSGSTPSDVADTRTVSCGFWLPTAVVAWAMGIARSSASPAKATSKPILNLDTIRSLLDLLLAALFMRPTIHATIYASGFPPVRPSTQVGAIRWTWSFPYPELRRAP